MSAETFLAVLCPELALQDYELIQRWRREHDGALADQILPHFTLVSPVTGWRQGDFVREVQTRLAGQQSFAIELSGAVSHRDETTGKTQDWLVPGAGRETIKALQERLHAGAFKPLARADIEYSPHITIGCDSDPAASAQRIADLNEAGVSMHCKAGALEIVSRKGDRLRTIERMPFYRES